MTSSYPPAKSVLRYVPLFVLLAAVFTTLGLADVRLPMWESDSPPFPAAVTGSSPATNNPWRNRAWLDVHLAQACDAVEWVCGEPFSVRPVVYSQSLDDMVSVWRRNREIRCRHCKETDKGEEWLRDQAAMEHILGIYLSSIHAVCISRIGVENSVEYGARASLLSAGALRLILLHEVVHAFDYERYPDLVDPCNAWLGGDARHAVVEGHAQHVCALVAERWKLTGAFADLRAHYGGGTSESEASRRSRGTRDLPFFSYVTGQDFFDAVYDAGGRGAVSAILADPDLSYLDIRRPGAWLKAQGYESLLISDD